VGPRNHVLDGVEIPTGRGTFGELSGLLKSIESLCCGVCSERDNSILNNDTTARLLHPTAMLQTGRCHITFSPVKNLPCPCDAAFR